MFERFIETGGRLDEWDPDDIVHPAGHLTEPWSVGAGHLAIGAVVGFGAVASVATFVYLITQHL